MVRPGRDRLNDEVEVDETLGGGKKKYVDVRLRPMAGEVIRNLRAKGIFMISEYYAVKIKTQPHVCYLVCTALPVC